MFTRVKTSSQKGEKMVAQLLKATEKQQREDGSMRTPLDSVNAIRRRNILTSKWKGTAIAARIIDSVGSAEITRHGVYQEGYDNDLDLIKFGEAKGRVEILSPNYGGYIELTSGTCISLRAYNEGDTIPDDHNLGLEVEVLAEHDPFNDIAVVTTQVQ